MKTKKYILAALAAAFTLSLGAQQVTTIYFLENAPMRHTINPAFQPVSNGFFNFTPLGWMSFGFGNNSLTMSDVIFVDNNPDSPTYGKTITFLHPNADRTAFLKQMRSMVYTNMDMTFGFLNFGFRVKDVGYVTIGINERIETGFTVPKSLMTSLLGGGMTNLDGGVNTIGLSGFGSGFSLYTEIGGGYSHKINDQWTVGGKLKLLLGSAYVGYNSKHMELKGSTSEWNLKGEMGLDISGPFNSAYIGRQVDGKTALDLYNGFVGGEEGQGIAFNTDSLIDLQNIPALLKPSGIGVAFDLGFTYKPIEYLQISAGITDLGFIYWKGSRFSCDVNSTFSGVDIDYSDPSYRDENGNFSTSILMDSVTNHLVGLLDGVSLAHSGAGRARMVSARLNIGLDANVWDNRIGLGIVSATRLYNARLYEEVTFGLAFRPVNWFNIAMSYSLLNNGKYSNIGAGLSLMPYDGINFTLAMDYMPTSYAGLPLNGKEPMYVIPDKMKMFNIALGFSIVWGTNKRDKDRDGVKDKFDLCPNTPRGVKVDANGCPLDEDHDGVPDYLDRCPGTLAAAIGFVDSVGCDRDSDGDGIPDYIDKCPNTPREAYGKVDEAGCPLDTDTDGVFDYLDECSDTPEAARGQVDEKGCPKDSDGDGVPDYLDECPDTPEEAYTTVDEKGCPADSDGDGVPDYLDECPDTKIEAIGFVDEKGCDLDSDGDGVPDYKDQCPNTPAEAYDSVDEKGCPADSDEDGVADFMDECPNTPKAAIGHVDEKGCELDSDGDEVPDYKDECPTVPGVKNNKGCPEIKREVRQLLQKAMQGIEFETGKATIKKKSFPLLDQIAASFIENSNYIIEVQGHTDNVGNADYNMKLSDDRANAVRNYLISKGVESTRMMANGYGMEQPIADNNTKAGRQKNRRVEFKISFEEVHIETILDHADPEPADSTAILQQTDSTQVNQ